VVHYFSKGKYVKAMKKSFVFLIGLVLVAVMMGVACRRNPAPDPALNPPAEIKAGPVVKGSSLNDTFPASSDGFTRTFTQEKSGFVLAELTKEGKKVATLAVNDINNNPDTINKFKSSTEKIAGYPMSPDGSMGTAILVGNRFQIKVRSLAPSFTAQDRAAWIQKFNLSQIEGMK
jgi:hypothetical protein